MSGPRKRNDHHEYTTIGEFFERISAETAISGKTPCQRAGGPVHFAVISTAATPSPPQPQEHRYDVGFRVCRD